MSYLTLHRSRFFADRRIPAGFHPGTMPPFHQVSIEPSAASIPGSSFGVDGLGETFRERLQARRVATRQAYRQAQREAQEQGGSAPRAPLVVRMDALRQRMAEQKGMSLAERLQARRVATRQAYRQAQREAQEQGGAAPRAPLVVRMDALRQRRAESQAARAARLAERRAARIAERQAARQASRSQPGVTQPSSTVDTSRPVIMPEDWAPDSTSPYDYTGYGSTTGPAPEEVYPDNTSVAPDERAPVDAIPKKGINKGLLIGGGLVAAVAAYYMMQ